MNRVTIKEHQVDVSVQETFKAMIPEVDVSVQEAFEGMSKPFKAMIEPHGLVMSPSLRLSELVSRQQRGVPWPHKP